MPGAAKPTLKDRRQRLIRNRMQDQAMSQNIFIAAYDGTDRHAIDFAAARAKCEGAAVHVVHVLEWSPYTFLTPEELAQRHKVRQEELNRADTAVLQPVLQSLRAAGVSVSGEIRHGNVVDVLSAIAMEKGAALIVAGRSSSLTTRVFGSVASGLAQSAPVPVAIVP
jgi:nucleotide-binding universal stress UspA family protein